MRAIDYFDKGAEAYPDRCAIIDDGSRYSYSETRGLTEKIASVMRSSGLAGQERAAIYSPNDARVLLCMLGILRAGAVWVPINYRNSTDAIIAYMNYVETSWLFYHSRYADEVERVTAKVPTLSHLVCLDAKGASAPLLDEFMGLGSSAPYVDLGDPQGNPDDLVGLVPTGGTTGPAKGVRVTNLAWGTMTEMATHYWRTDAREPICLNTAPLSHAAGVVAFTMFTQGATNLIMQGFDALEVMRHIERYKVTHLFLPPTAFYGMLSHPRVHDFDYSSLRLFLLAGSPVSPDKLMKGVEIFGPCMCQCYGQTESPMLLTWLDQRTVAAAAGGDHPERLRSCGKPTSAVRLAIMDDSGRLLPPGERGEIVARGSLVTPGYFNMPEATAEIRAHGWHHTGDIGYVDEYGYYYIVDRKKDMIITGGFNVFCGEVEAGIMGLPQVHECAVIGIPDEKWGEAVKAIVVPSGSQSLTEEAVIAHCREQLGPVKAPKSVEFREDIPKTPAGKIDRRALRRPYWSNKDREVH